MKENNVFGRFYVEETVTHLWCHVIWCAAESVCHPVQEDLQFAHSKICDSDMSIEIQEDIVQFQISVCENQKYPTINQPIISFK